MNPPQSFVSSHALCVAPMMDWTDRHCRYFHRILAPHARLYTEMVTTGALIHGNQARHLDFDAAEHPVALQLGGSDAADLAHCAKLGEQWGYDEINLNCGCPSERVQRGAFGACLMLEPQLVADCVKAMQDAVSVPVSVKHRLGVNDINDYSFVRDFVGTLAFVGCKIFIVHARNAILKGLSPKENREIPPLKYDFVHQLRHDFPDLIFILNGGLQTVEPSLQVSQNLQGMMLGRVAYHEPYRLAEFEAAMFNTPLISREQVLEKMLPYCQTQMAQGVPLFSITRHLLGLVNGLPGARAWRRGLSDAKALQTAHPNVLFENLPPETRQSSASCLV